MKRLGVVFSIIIFVMLTGACAGSSSGGAVGDNANVDIPVGDAIGAGSDGSETAPDSASGNSADYSTDDSAMAGRLSIERDRIDLLMSLYPDTDGIACLQNKFPDLVQVDSEDKTQTIWAETWHSETSGLSYWALCSSGNNGNIDSSIYKIFGPAKNLIAGLYDPVNVNDFMKLLDIPDSDWAIGKAPSAPGYDYYGPWRFDNATPEDLCFVIPDFYSVDMNHGSSPYGIIITMSTIGYVASDDSFEIEWAGYGD